MVKSSVGCVQTVFWGKCCVLLLALIIAFAPLSEAKAVSEKQIRQEISGELARYNRLLADKVQNCEPLLELSFNMAGKYHRIRDYSSAEKFLQNALELSQYSRKKESWKYNAYCDLARLKKQAGYPREAETFIDKALTIARQAGSERRKDAAWGIASLLKAEISYQLQKTTFSEKYYQEALQAFSKSPDRFCKKIFEAHQGLGLNHLGHGDEDLAISSFQKGIDEAKRHRCITDGNRSTALNNLGLAYYSKGELKKAIEHLSHALELTEKSSGGNSESSLTLRNNLAELHRKSGDTGKTLRDSERYFSAVSSQFEKYLMEQGESFAKGYSRGEQNQATRSAFITLAKATKAPSPELFRAYQLAKLNSTNIAYNAMLEAGNKKHGSIDTLVARRKKLLSSLEYQNNITAGDVDSRLTQLLNELEENRREIDKIDPDFFSIYLPRHLSLTQLQSVLEDEEAALAYLVDTEDIYVFVIEKKNVSFKKVKINYRKLDEQIRHMRERLDPRKLGMYPAKIGYDLYQQLIEPLDLPGNVRKLLIVPDGLLDSLPFSALISEKPPESRLSLRKLKWIVDDYAVSYYPSVSIIHTLRTRSPQAEPDLSFIGFANPHFNDLEQEYRAISAQKIYNKQQKVTLPIFQYISNLPETQQEVEAIAALFPQGQAHIYSGENASERNLKSLNLSRYKYVIFATHGLVSGDFQGLMEPALVLTPPARISGLNDGLLKASEISALQFNADLTVLSACNTASPDGENGAEGLSGLAKSFLYAGSRAVLVSHWPVNSVATVETTTSFFSFLSTAGESVKAEALQKAKIQLKKKYPNPSYWAPFVLIGE